jgi:hypothetical protein
MVSVRVPIVSRVGEAPLIRDSEMLLNLRYSPE